VFQVWVNFVVKGLAVDAGPTPARTRGVPALDHEILHQSTGQQLLFNLPNQKFFQYTTEDDGNHFESKK
jgi:hypothetical protein